MNKPASSPQPSLLPSSTRRPTLPLSTTERPPLTMVQTRRNSFCVPSLPPLGSRHNVAVAPSIKRPANDRPPLPPSGGHFLRDVNLDHCSDLLSIPDPPSPPPRNLRRQSSPMLRPLRDVTNEAAHGVPSPLVVASGKRSRKSLCHVPSPALEQNGLTSTEPLPAEEMAKSKEAVGITICFDDDDAATVSASKRQKRRESMILPSDIAPLHQGEDNKDFDHVHSYQTNEVQRVVNVSLSSTETEQEDDDGVKSARNRPARRHSIILPSDVASLKNDDAIEYFAHLQSHQTTEAESQATVGGERHLSKWNDKDDASSTSKRPARRQSLVLPSDFMSLQDADASEYFGHLRSYQTKEAQPVANIPKEHSVTERNNEEESTSTIQRSARRQSMIHRSESARDGQEDGTTFDRPAGDKTEGTSTGANGAAKEPGAIPKDANEMDTIRTLVRKYCSLPLSERNSSKHAEEIERLTGYGIIPPSEKARKERRARGGVDLNWSGSSKDGDAVQLSVPPDQFMIRKRELLEKLSALVDVMDRRKAEDGRFMATKTRCRFKRTRNGKYRYLDIATNGKVSPEEYEERYLAALEQCRPEIQKRIQDWIASVHSDREDSDSDTDELCVRISPLVDSVQLYIQSSTASVDAIGGGNESDDETAIHDQCVKISSLVESAQARKDSTGEASAFPPAYEPNDVEEVLSPELGSTSSVRSSADSDKNASPCVVVGRARAYAQSDDMQVCDGMELDSSVLSLGEALEIETITKKSLYKDESPSHNNEDEEGRESPELLLPFPCRDDTSDDPAIAAAEERLWAAIDDALETYSRQVIAIREARRRAGVSAIAQGFDLK